MKTSKVGDKKGDPTMLGNKISLKLGVVLAAFFLVTTLAQAKTRTVARNTSRSVAKSGAKKSFPKAPPSSAVRDEGGGSDYVIEKRGDTTIKYKKKTTYDFEGANIDGIYNKPSGSYISNIKDVKAKSIIRIRENFDPEVLDSGRLIK